MSEPEPWTSDPTSGDWFVLPLADQWNPPSGQGRGRLVRRVPFGEAVQRMLDEWCEMADSSVGSGPSGYDRGRLRPVMCYLLAAAAGLTHSEADTAVRAALGEDTE